MDHMDLEDDKSLLTVPESSANQGISNESTTNGKSDHNPISSVKQEPSVIVVSPDLTSLTPHPLTTTSSSLSSLSTSVTSTSMNASTVGNCNLGSYGAKKPLLIKPSTLLGVSTSHENDTSTFSASVSASLFPTLNTSPICSKTIFPLTDDGCKNSTWPPLASTNTSWSWSTSRGLSDLSDAAVPSTSLLNPQVPAANNSSSEGSSLRLGAAALATHTCSPHAMNKINSNFLTWRKGASPTRGSRRPEMKRGMKGKQLKQLHQQIHYLKSYFSPVGPHRDIVSQNGSVGISQSGEGPIFTDALLPGDGSGMQSWITKMLRRKLRQRRNMGYHCMQRPLMNPDSSSNQNPGLLETNVNMNSANVEFSASDAYNMDIADADSCFFKSILPDVKLLNDSRKLQFKSFIMGRLSELIIEQRHDSESSEQKHLPGQSTSQMVSSEERDLSISMQQAAPATPENHNPSFPPHTNPFKM